MKWLFRNERRPAGRDLRDIEAVVRNRSVALVGNASSLFEKHHPIDQHDVVVRINAGPFVEDAERRAGSRTDILLVSGFRDEKYLAAAPHIIWMTPKRRSSLSRSVQSRLYFYPEDWWEILASEIGARPSTGCMGIDLISRLLGDGSLHLYGFDFWKSPTTYTGEVRLGPHSPSSEEEYARSKVPASNIA